MVYNDTISLFDVAKNDDGNLAVIQYVISGVYFEKATGTVLDKDGIRKSYNATLFIPDSMKSDDNYIKPKAWERLRFKEKVENFTIREGQVIVQLGEEIKMNSLDDIVNYYDDAFRVIGVEYLDKVLPHFEVLCK